MKPMNWISATGFNPCVAMPTDMPAMVASASGVSCTRSVPKRACSPAVARNTPPLTPTSCPSTTTFSSCCISQPCAIAMASTMVIFANSMTAGLRAVFSRRRALLAQVRRQRREQMLEHGVRRGLGALQVFADCRINRARAIHEQRLLLRLRQGARLVKICPQPLQGLERPCLLDPLEAAIPSGVVGGGVIAQAVGERLDESRAAAAARGGERPGNCGTHREHVVAVHLHARNAGGHGFLCERSGGRLL